MLEDTEKTADEADQSGEQGGGGVGVLDDPRKDSSPAKRFMDSLFKLGPVIATPKMGDLIEGHVLSKKGPCLYLDLGPYGTGVIFGREYYNARDLIKPLKPGDSVLAKVVEIENEEGYTELSLREAGRDKMWQEAETLMKSKTPIPLKVFSANKGGLVIYWQGVQGFLPVSQLIAKHYPRVEGGDKNRILSELQKFVGEIFDLTILDFDPRENKLIFSEKNIESEELKETLSHFTVGATIEGEVTGVVDFGVFIKIEDGLEGLAHISELDWGLVESPADLFKIGEKVQAKIINIEGGKISLSIKALKPDPWQQFAQQFKKGDIIKGKIRKIDRFGAFVEIENYNLSGLAHVSEFGSEKVMRETIDLGITYHFQVINLSPDDRKLSLSFIKEGKDGVPEAPAAEAVPAIPVEEQKTEIESQSESTA